jgi:hypothetical protein
MMGDNTTAVSGGKQLPPKLTLPFLNLTKQPSTTMSEISESAQPRKILFADHFIVDQSTTPDRLNTAILEETFQMTVRNRIFDHEDEKQEIFNTAKDDI